MKIFGGNSFTQKLQLRLILFESAHPEQSIRGKSGVTDAPDIFRVDVYVGNNSPCETQKHVDVLLRMKLHFELRKIDS